LVQIGRMKKVNLPGYKLPYLYEHAGRYIYRRVIPSELRRLAGGLTQFKHAFRTSDVKTAVIRYGDANSEIEAKLEQLREGKPLSKRKPPAVKELRKITGEMGLPYLSADQLIQQSSIAAITDRMNEWQKAGKPAGPTLDALFGSAPNTVTMDDVLAFYEEHTRERLSGLSDREISKKRSPVKLAVRRFNEFADGPTDILALSRKKALDFRSHLVKHIEAGRMIGGTVNKQLTHVRKLINFYIDQNGLELANPFANVSVVEDDESRLPFTVQFVREKWLQGNPFGGLNEEARAILFAMIDTGCGGKEICGLAPGEIRLNDDIPHIVVQPNTYRKLKTGHRGRKIPLVGNALSAFTSFPEGFPRYRMSPGADNLSNTLMKFLRKNGLLETANHKVYGLRHMFMDRMRACGFPEELQNYLMGHKHPTMGARYGTGYSLSSSLDHMRTIEAHWL
jgi:integrase